jgi:ATP-dependent protease ClpP protease subunit
VSKRKTSEPRPYTITNVGGNKVEILIYEQIGSDFWSEGITAKQFVHDLQSKGKVRRIDLRINSPGGSFFDGLAIYNTLKNHPAIVDVYIDGIAFSMASVIAMAGDTISMAKNALMMVHNPSGAVAGSPEQIRAYLELMEKARESIVTAYQEKTGIEREELMAMLTAETYLDADEAVDKGFADEVTEQLAVAAHGTLPEFIHVPADVAAKLKSLDKEPEMADQTPNDAGTPERIPASIQQLKAMPGVDAEFIVDQLTVHATVEDAQQALNARLLDRLNAANAEIASLRAKAAATPPPVAPAAPPAPSVVQPVDIGTEPLVSSSAGSDPSAITVWGDEPAKFHRQLMRKLTAEGMSASAALQRISEDYPQLIDELLQ